MKRYPIGVQDFEQMRTGHFVYVDKTRLMFELAQSGKYFFLSRPRRFGKSLLLSTLKYFFLGRRDLFTGLWVDREGAYDWAEHPVLHFSFSSTGYKDIGLVRALDRLVTEGAEQHGIRLHSEGLSGRFRELLHTLGSGPRKVVLLIDEYDKPLIDYLEDLPQAQAHREVFKTFFSVIKDADPYLRFVLITGVSKFSKVSIFSDLNHLLDLTFVGRYADLTGYTQTELEACFAEEIENMARGSSREAVLDEIRTWYNGYQWEVGKPVYNPFSVLSLFYSGRFANYWWETGTPTFLLKALEQSFVYDMQAVQVGSSVFDSYTLEDLNWTGLMFQTGYLTITHYDRELELYTLSYPNREVRASMFQYLLAVYRHAPHTETQAIYAGLKMAFDAGDLEGVIRQLNRVFSTIPHQIFLARQEAFFHAVLHLTFQGLGLLTQSEVSTSLGRADCVVWSRSGVYVLELKLGGSVRADLDQIRDRQYGHRFLGQGMPVTAVGICFSPEQKAVEAWEATPYEVLIA